MPHTLPPPLRLAATIFFAVVMAVGPLGLMQGVAWSSMAIDYSQRFGWAEGLSRTFDGKNPCHLCASISDTKREQTQSHTATLAERWQPLGPTASTILAPLPGSTGIHKRFFAFLIGQIPQRAEAPALPPPRHLAA